MFTKVGQTVDGTDTFSGVFKFYETHGMPFEVLLGIMKDMNRMPSWLHLYDEALAAGMQHKRIQSMLDSPICDVYGPKFRDVVLERLNKYRTPNQPKGGSHG
jgi:hypothetical protein